MLISRPSNADAQPCLKKATWHRPWTVVCTAALCLLASISASQPRTQLDRPTEYDVEAAYLFNFGKFVKWPQDAHAPATFNICVLGDDPFGSALDKITAGETIGGKKIADKRITRAQDTVGCSILYISDSEAERVSRILAAVRDAPVLTVSHLPDFLERGGTIQFVLENGRVRFQVNLVPTQRDGLMLSSELLKVAVRVIRGSAEGVQ